MIVGAVLLLLGAGAYATGVLSSAALASIADRVVPILVFVVAISIVAELATRAGVFDRVAHALAKWARGRVLVLWMLVVGFSVLVTATLSLDTTAVLLTPIVLVLARRHGLAVVPFALATVWLANTASLLLPISNLTNLLAVARMPELASPVAFLSLLGPSALIAVIVPVAMLWVMGRRDLRGRFHAAPPPHVGDRVLLIGAGAIVALTVPVLVSGIEPWIPASVGAVAMLVLFAWRSPRSLSVRIVPIGLLVFAAGLFVAVGAAESMGVLESLAASAGTGDDLLSLWQVGGLGMLAANGVNNLPAYLLLEPAATTPVRLAALLIGVNAGPLITPWASLATLLWHERVRSSGVDISWSRYVLLGVALAPITVALSIMPLAWR